MIDLTGRTDVPVAEEALVELASICRELELEFLVVGAASRGLVIHALQQSNPIRSTEGIDIAVAVRVGEQFAELTDRLTRKGNLATHVRGARSRGRPRPRRRDRAGP